MLGKREGKEKKRRTGWGRKEKRIAREGLPRLVAVLTIQKRKGRARGEGEKKRSEKKKYSKKRGEKETDVLPLLLNYEVFGYFAIA